MVVVEIPTCFTVAGVGGTGLFFVSRGVVVGCGGDGGCDGRGGSVECCDVGMIVLGDKGFCDGCCKV